MHVRLRAAVVASCLFALVHIRPSCRADPFNMIDIPLIPINLASFDHVEDGFDPEHQALSLYWSIENLGSQGEIIHGCLFLNLTKIIQNGGAPKTENVSNAWAAIGFGETMMAADFTLMHGGSSGSDVELYNLVSSGGYKAPAQSAGSSKIFPAPPQNTVNQHVRFQSREYMIAEFRRYTIPELDDTDHMMVKVFQDTPVIWAYNINPISTPSERWLTYHGKNRGAYMINFNSGMGYSVPTTSVATKEIHGFFMALVWLIILPTGVVWSRYIKSIPKLNNKWMYVHAGIQGSGVAIALIFALYMIFNLPKKSNFELTTLQPLSSTPHSKIGFVITAGLFNSLIMGLLNYFSLSHHKLEKYRVLFQFIHVWFGRALMLVSIVQTGLGLQTIYPFPDTLPSHYGRGFGWWIVYFLVVAGWILIFSWMEFQWVKYVRVKTTSPLLSKSAKETASLRLDRLKGSSRQSSILPVDKTAAIMKSYSWKTLSDEVANGGMLVVANGKYVYDVSNWLFSHPGGQLILYSVVGTDITNDFFREAEFDINAYMTKEKPLQPTRDRSIPTQSSLNTPSLTSAKDAQKIRTETLKKLNINTLELTPIELKSIMKARRTHVHTHLAIEKLISLQVGEILPEDNMMHTSGLRYRSNGGTLSISGGSGGGDSIRQEEGNHFSVMEYRRYAIIESEVETLADASRPAETKKHEPTFFRPGQAVEIQVRINNTWISRYYTPISGSPACFQVLIKLKPGGLLTPFLLKQKCGDRQIKVRGPFGGDDVRMMVGVGKERHFWEGEDVVFICAGSGLAPALQLVEHVCLPVNIPVQVIQNYTAAYDDELDLVVGDWIIPKVHLLDGWAQGINIRTGREGLFPVPITRPRRSASTTPLKITIVNCQSRSQDIFGMNILKGAMIAHPDKISIMHILGHGSLQENSSLDIPGPIVSGRIQAQYLKSIFKNWNGKSESKVIVCGPNDFEGVCCDMLVQELGVDHDDIVLLPDDHCI